MQLLNACRLSGDYESLTAGNAKDALVDMTGGVGERITLAEYKTEDQRKDLFRILRHSKEDHSLMSASIQVCVLPYRCKQLVNDCAIKNNFLISLPKHMLWVLKRTVSMRRFF